MPQQFFPRWLPIQIASHYGFPLADWDGSDQKIAIISLGGKIDEARLRRNFKALRIPYPDVRIKDVSEKYSDSQNEGPIDETLLDLQVVGTICSAAKITIYRGANDCGPGFTDAVRRAVEDDNSVISISWGHTETHEDPSTEGMEAVLRQAKLQDISVCVAAGDAGSSDHRQEFHAIPAEDGLAHVQYPASSPYVLSCGGTQLMLQGDDYHEVVWNNSSIGRAATGGGVSDIFEQPDWQTDSGVDIPSANDGMRKGRVMPDVAALAAGGAWGMFKYGKSTVAGGTSAVAPLYASLISLANQKRHSLGKNRIGFLNEKLYRLAGHSDVFNTIQVGHNRPVENYPGYDARDGFDACTGWGTPKADKLFIALVELD